MLIRRRPRSRALRGARLLLAAFLALGLAGCGRKSDSDRPSAGGSPAAAGVKIGLMTGTVSQGEDEFRAAELIARKYPGRVRHVTYPDNFMQEQETVIAQLTGLAADPEIKVIVASQAIPGSLAALRKIRESRPDIRIGFVEPHEDPVMVNAEVDIGIQPDQLARGRTIVELARQMGATQFVHYSFPRHMSMELLARRRDIMREACVAGGMGFQFVTAPDPMGEGGLPATQQFILEDVPRELAKLGPATAFFSTNCGTMDPLIRSVLQHGGYFVEQCCPSPTHGYPTALGIAIPPEHAGDMDYINTQNKAKIAEAGGSGRFATWPVPESMLATRTVVDLLVDSAEGRADYRDPATVQRYLAERAGVPVTLTRYDPNQGNSYLILVGNLVY